MENGITDFFDINMGIQQGYILLSFLFLLVVDFIMRNLMQGQRVSIPWTDHTQHTDLDFVEDIALLVDLRTALWTLTTSLITSLEYIANNVSLKISTNK